MVSINTSANAAVLANLRKINNDIATTQLRIGTGKKVNSASDNPTVWAVAQSVRSDEKAQATIVSGMAIAKGRAEAASAALDTVNDLLGQIKAVAEDVTVNTPSDAYAAAIKKVTGLQKQIKAALAGATFQGENWLTDAGATKTITIGVSQGSKITTDVDTLQLDNTGTDLTAALAAATGTTLPDTTATGVAKLAEVAQQTVTAYQATLDSAATGFGAQIDFLAKLSSIREATISSLVDADLTEESARASALQTQQALAYQALSIGNSSSQNILRLFQ
jgi:flagellin